MADVTGPISTLPGSRHKLPPGATCDEHPDRPAAARVQGETDSFGSEMVDVCEECLQAIAAHEAAAREEERYCQWCRAMAKDVRAHRDLDEGMAGPVYQVCAACRRAENERLQEELADYEGTGRWDWDEE